MNLRLVSSVLLSASLSASSAVAQEDGHPAAPLAPAPSTAAPAPAATMVPTGTSTPAATATSPGAVAPVASPSLASLPLRTPPVGRAAPPTESASHGDGPVRAGLEVFASYTYQNLAIQDGTRSWYHVFDLPRAHAAIEGEIDQVRGRVVLEAVRSASEGALLGVSGDSFVMRVREAYAAYEPLDVLEVQGGVIPTATIPQLDGTWMMRAVAPSALEASGLVAPADVGGRVRTTLPRKVGFVSVSAYNGEGYTNRELNRGKNVEIAADFHPFAPLAPSLLPLGIFGSYVTGSAGATKARADRLTGGVIWQGARVRGGAYGTYAIGVRDLATQHAIVWSAFIRVEPVERLLLGARADHFVRDTEAPAVDSVTTILGSVGWRLAEPLESFLTVSRSLPSARAQASLPGTDAWEVRAALRVFY